MITRYHRPQTLDEAIALTARPNAVIVGGGTVVSTRRDDADLTAVDLQSLALGGIETDGSFVRIGATTRLQDVVESPVVPAVLRELAGREAPSTIRNAATIGGVVATADPESELLTGLLAFGAAAALARAGSTTEHTVDEVLTRASALNGAIITSISMPSVGVAASDRTGRTPMDRPIVSAVAYRGAGEPPRLALSGVAARPIVVDPERLGDLDPPSDFRGGSAYRGSIARVLADRVLRAIAGGAS